MDSEKVYAMVILGNDENFAKIGYIGRVDHSDVQLFFDDGSYKYYHAMSLRIIKNA